jgi:hypothetical protein
MEPAPQHNGAHKLQAEARVLRRPQPAMNTAAVAGGDWGRQDIPG